MGPVGTHDVQMREPFKGPSFPEQTDPCSSVLAAIRAQDLGDAAAVPLLAPDIVDVEGMAPAKVGQDLVAGRKTLAFAQRRAISRSISSSCTDCGRPRSRSPGFLRGLVGVCLRVGVA